MIIQYPGDFSNYDEMSNFVDLNELPLVINYADKEVSMWFDLQDVIVIVIVIVISIIW